MKILTVDIGTGTQDIFLYNSQLELENCFKLVVPSPTMIVHHRLKEATRCQEAVLLSGVTMGGGPCAWAAEAHVQAGLPLYATPSAARTFNDDLQAVSLMGVQVLSEDEALGLPDSVVRLELKDLDFPAITRSLEQFGLRLDELAAVAVAVFDHGDSPPGYSDRQFRFDYLDARIRAANSLSAFAYPADKVPASMTRMQAVVASGRGIDAPLMVMDTAPAAVLGATLDRHVGERRRVIVANVGNFHTLAFRLGPGGIEGVFEHHTGLIDLPRLEMILGALADGSLRHADIFEENGHGALVYEPSPISLEDGPFGVAVTGPRRGMMAASRMRPYFAVPYGDMMLAGCFGMLAATADVLPGLGEEIGRSLDGSGKIGVAPWDVD